MPIDRIRGSVNLPLTHKGLHEVEEVGRKFQQGGGLQHIMTSDMSRTQATAQALSRHTGGAISTTPALRDMAYGALEGKPSKEAIHTINDHIVNHSDTPLPGRSPQSTSVGESFNQYKNRMLPVIQAAIAHHEANPYGRHAIVLNRRSIKTIEGFLDTGTVHDLNTNPEKVTEFKGDSTKPASVFKMNKVDKDHYKVSEADPSDKGPGIFLVRHGQTAWNGDT